MLSMLKKVANYVAVFFEIVVPTVSLIGIFVIFNLQILYRYVLESPLVWAYEASLTLFVWLIMFGAVYAWRKKEHVQFSIFYDLVSDKIQLYVRLFSNLLVIIFLSLILLPIGEQLIFLNRMKSSQLDLPLSIVFLPMLISFLFIIIYSLIDIFHDIQKLRANDGDYTETVYKDRYVELEPQDENEIAIFSEQEASVK